MALLKGLSLILFCVCGRQFNSEYWPVKALMKKMTQEHYQYWMRIMMRSHNIAKNAATSSQLPTLLAHSTPPSPPSSVSQLPPLPSPLSAAPPLSAPFLSPLPSPPLPFSLSLSPA